MALDTQLFTLLHSLAGQSPVADQVIVFFASYLAYILIGLFVVLVYLSRSPKRDKLEILLFAGLASVIARFGVTELIRYFYNRPRPFVALSIQPLFTDSAWSFPSGHATFFFALSTAVYLYNKKWGVIFYLATLLITVSRVIAGVHYPSDILAGAIIGILVAYIVFFIAGKVLGTDKDTTETGH